MRPGVSGPRSRWTVTLPAQKTQGPFVAEPLKKKQSLAFGNVLLPNSRGNNNLRCSATTCCAAQGKMVSMSRVVHRSDAERGGMVSMSRVVHRFDAERGEMVSMSRVVHCLLGWWQVWARRRWAGRSCGRVRQPRTHGAAMCRRGPSRAASTSQHGSGAHRASPPTNRGRDVRDPRCHVWVRDSLEGGELFPALVASDV